MLKCLNKKECTLKDLLDILCNYKKFKCKEGNLDQIIKFVKNKKSKAIILLMKGNLKDKEAKQYAFLISEYSKTKKVVWAIEKNKELCFKVLIAS